MTRFWHQKFIILYLQQQHFNKFCLETYESYRPLTGDGSRTVIDSLTGEEYLE